MWINKLTYVSLTLIPALVQGNKLNLRKALVDTPINATQDNYLDTYNENIPTDNNEILQISYLESNDESPMMDGEILETTSEGLERSLALLGDWSLCSSSSQCARGCCTSLWSNDGRLKCTPLSSGFSFTGNKCVGSSGSTSSGGGSLGDWSSCSSSSQCGSRCCSAKYSQGLLKCTPLGSGFNPTVNGCVGDSALPEGSACNDSSKCASGCCSSWSQFCPHGRCEVKWVCMPMGMITNTGSCAFV